MISRITPLILLFVSGCSPTEIAQTSGESRCESQPLNEIFANPLESIGTRFCGEVQAVRESRTVKFFPADAPIPTERTDIVLIPDSKFRAVLEQRIPEGSSRTVYVEGTIGGDRSCFVDMAIDCLPYRRPLKMRVSAYSIRADGTE